MLFLKVFIVLSLINYVGLIHFQLIFVCDIKVYSLHLDIQW